jgi:DNA-directed RNA polymerases I, II, and III subunit RPABC2
MSQDNDDIIDLSEDESQEDDDEDESESYQPPIKIEKTVNNIELELDDIDAEIDSKNGSDVDDDEDDDDDDEDDNNKTDDDENDGEGDPDIDYLGIKTDAKMPFGEFDSASEDNDDDDEDDENGEAYLQKLDSSLQQQIISDYHPELKSHNNVEIELLSRVVRDENGVVIDPLHKTLPFITRYEKARILGERAKQLNSGAKPLIDIEPSIIDGYLIALKEYEQKKIPFIIKRPIPNGGIEYWKFEDLEMID